MEKNNSADSWFNFKPMVGGRITSGARKHKLFNEVRLVIGDFELPLQFKKIEATNMVKRTIVKKSLTTHLVKKRQTVDILLHFHR